MHQRKYIKTTLKEYLKENTQSNLNDNFYNWFGNSKIVDSSNKPLVVYHGTNSDIESFSDIKKGSSTDPGIRGRGFYFSTNIKSSQSYGKNLYKVYLKVVNPFDLLSFNSLDEIADILEIDPSIIHDRGIKGSPYYSISIYPEFSGIFSGSVREKGFDGILHGQEIVVFKPNQIKSIDNNGNWDINSENIYS
jgi:hypothetical protein